MNEHKLIDEAEIRAGVRIRVGVEVVQALGATPMEAGRLKVSSSHFGSSRLYGEAIDFVDVFSI